jgi:hypothetical protein
MKKIIYDSILFLLLLPAFAGAQTVVSARAASSENKVAVLPIVYISEGSPERVEEMRFRLQNIAYQYLKSEAMEFSIQTPAETNALLLRHGVNESNFREFTPRELAAILEVEYVLSGMVTQEVAGEASTSTSSRRDHNDRNRNRNRNWRVKTEQTRTTEILNTHIDLDIYNDKGVQIFSKSRRSILSDVDAYKNGIQYLLKRSPLYKR